MGDSSEEIPQSENVTHSFDRSKKYYRVLRYNEKKYFSGRNHPSNYTQAYEEENLYWPAEADGYEGGFYFTNVECVFNYMFHWGDRVSEVSVPNEANIYKEDPKHHFGDNVWRASEIILSEPVPITVDVMKRLIKEGGVLNNYNIEMCERGIKTRIQIKDDNDIRKYEKHITSIEAEDVLIFLENNKK